MPSAMSRRGSTTRWLTGVLTLTTLPIASSFAYAPNFVTKIIQDQIDRTTLSSDDVMTVAAGESPTMVGSIRTRFPPEPNGYLHLGHAKAISFNFAVAQMFDGTCNMRMDDTNPEKEDEEYVQSILEDVRWIRDGLYDPESAPWEGPVRKTSDYFDLIYECALAMLQSGDAYVDSLTADEMREYRGSLTDPGRDSPHRTRSIEENVQLFTDMKAGVYPDGAHVVRAKLDMASPNLNMRDPALYRIKHDPPHQETGDQWCIYPMYDFSHPIADAVEGITHSLCTLEFEDHRPFYDWTVSKLNDLGLLTASPQQIEFSRLNIQSTVLSKRKLIQLVQEGHVSGWDDPRLPTLSGLRRRGISPASLRLFCERVGISKADSNLAYSVLEDCVRETSDSTCPRAMAVLQPLRVTIADYGDDIEEIEVDRHPKLDMGTRNLPFGNTVYIERTDFFDTEGPEGQANCGKIPKGFKRLVLNNKVRLRYAYVIECNEVIRDAKTQEPIELKCSYYPESRAGVTPKGMSRVKGIIHWVEATTAIKCTVNQYDRLFASDEPGKESGDFLEDINPSSLQVLQDVVVEPDVANDALDVQEIVSQCNDSLVKVYPSSLTYQFERSGYFALDTSSSTKEGNLVFNRVVTLRDTWGVNKKDSNLEVQRNRGGDGKGNSSKQKSDGSPIEDIRRAALKAVTIVSVEPHPEAENLVVCRVDCGEVSEDGEMTCRTVVAGLAGKIQPEEMVGSKVVAVTNLKPAKMRGIESTAMLLAAACGRDGDDEIVELLTVPDSVSSGELLSFEGKQESSPDALLKSKGALKSWDRAKSGLRLNTEGEALYTDANGSYRMMSSSGCIKCSTLTDAAIQ